MTGVAVKTLLQKMSVKERDACFEMTLKWLTAGDDDDDDDDDKNNRKRRGRSTPILPQWRLGAQLIGLFAETEGAEFGRRIDAVLPILPAMMAPEKYEEDDAEDEEDAEMEEVVGEDGWTTMKPVKKDKRKETAKDSLLFMLVNSCKKIFVACGGGGGAGGGKGAGLWRSSGKRLRFVNSLLESTSSFLFHPHAWIRLTSSQIFGLYFASLKLDELKMRLSSTISSSSEAKALSTTTDLSIRDEEVPTFLLADDVIVEKIRRLSGAFCHQIESDFLTKDLATQIVKNLLFLAKLIRFLNQECPQVVQKEEDEEEEEEEID